MVKGRRGVVKGTRCGKGEMRRGKGPLRGDAVC